MSGSGPGADVAPARGAPANQPPTEPSIQRPAPNGPARQVTVDRSDPAHRAWVAAAVRMIEADLQRSADTHLLRFPLAAVFAEPGTGIDLYLKDESTHVTGSLKHRLARSLFLYSLCNGWLTGRTPPSSSRPAAPPRCPRPTSPGWSGLPFVAVMPARTSQGEDRADRGAGRPLPPGRRPGRHLRRVAPAGRRVRRALHGPVHLRRARHRLARQQQHRRVDLRPARDWSGTRCRSGWSSAPAPAGPARPSAGTSATAATRPGCACRTRRARRSSRPGGTATRAAPAPGSRIEGIGRPRVEPSFVGQVIDRMVQVPGRASVGDDARGRESVLGRRVGPSTGTNLWAAFGLIAEMRDRRDRRLDRHPAVRLRRPVRAHLLRRRLGRRAGLGPRPYRAGGPGVPGRRRLAEPR